MKNFNKKNKKGFMMVEIIIAVSIMLVVSIATLSVVQKGLKISGQSLHSTQAAFLLEEGGEIVRILRDGAWSNLSGLSLSTNYYPTFSGSTWTLSQTPNQVDSFTRTVTFSRVARDVSTGDIVSSGGVTDDGTLLVNVVVSWQEGEQNLSKNLSFYISNIFQ